MPEVGWRPAIMRSNIAMVILLTALTVLALPARADLPEAERLARPPAPSAQVGNFADELTDFGVTPQAELEPDFATPTPMTIPGAKVIRTAEAAALVREQRMLFVDVLLGAPHRTIPGALQLPGAGSASTFADDEILRKLGVTLAAYTKGDLDMPIAFFCYGAKCWESYNAALRAIGLGYRNTYWYRGGLAAWNAAGLPTVDPVLPGHRAQRLRSASRFDSKTG